MSTDGSRAERRRHRQYRRLVGLTVLLLGATVAVLTVANAVQGARVSGAELNPHALVARPAEPLTLRTSQPVEPVETEDVRVEPAASFTVESDPSAVVIRFDEMLDYRTEYEVQVDTVTAATGAASTLSYRFETPDATVYSLVRGSAQGTSDEVFRRELLDPGSAEAVFRAPRIQEYAVAGTAIAAVTLTDDGSTELVAAALDGGPEATIPTEPGGIVTDLASSGSSGLVGFVVTAADRSSRTLFVYDFGSGSSEAREIVGIGGTPLTVQDWAFVPNSTSVVVQSQDLMLYLVDVLGDGEAVPLGEHQVILGFIPGTTSLVVADAAGVTSIDVSSAEKAPLELPSDEAAPTDEPGPVVILGPERYAEVLFSPDYTKRPTQMNPRLMLVEPSGARAVFRPASDDTSIRDMCVSPNGRHLAIELLDGKGQPDGYPNLPGYSGMSIVFLDLATGNTTGGTNGFLPSWC
ncbi:hypothetical protein [Naasia sp. SYSU D00948]|uniref:hypothetical protein n=1 Tax=Naasia sp. SYSU D00948 TaxID=2817379 RepID=UPI001B303D2C|nr:hypothetical protein [Naasia sp. SYSU D00948]